jgi:hypothetical protein
MGSPVYRTKYLALKPFDKTPEGIIKIKKKYWRFAKGIGWFIRLLNRLFSAIGG